MSIPVDYLPMHLLSFSYILSLSPFRHVRCRFYGRELQTFQCTGNTGCLACMGRIPREGKQNVPLDGGSDEYGGNRHFPGEDDQGGKSARNFLHGSEPGGGCFQSRRTQSVQNGSALP